MRTTLHLAALAAAAALAATPALADDTFTCVPDKVAAGQQVAIKTVHHPGLFGSGPGPTSWVEYQVGTRTGRLPVVSWTPNRIIVSTPTGIGPGPVKVSVVVGGSAIEGPQPGCFGIPAVVAPLRGIAAPVVRQALTRVEARDWPCNRNMTITLGGTGFSPGTEQPTWGGRRDSRRVPMEDRWRTRTTMVELGVGNDEGAADYWTSFVSGVRINSSTSMDVRVSQCFVTEADAKARIWFPDGSKSDWVYLMTPIGRLRRAM
jgi:hypothetical protein